MERSEIRAIEPKRRTKAMPFQTGQSGNPAGRPRGSRNRRTIFLEHLLEADAETIARKVIDLAKAGDIAALRMCLDRLAPAPKGGPIEFELPPLERAADCVAATSALVAAVSAGEVAPSEALELAKVIELYVRALETAAFEERLMRLEQAQQASRADP
jgi:uncharacterized protein DUF5681